MPFVSHLNMQSVAPLIPKSGGLMAMEENPGG
jgi:hypothetical protein